MAIKSLSFVEMTSGGTDVTGQCMMGGVEYAQSDISRLKSNAAQRQRQRSQRCVVKRDGRSPACVRCVKRGKMARRGEMATPRL
jgi:hypothetical protein